MNASQQARLRATQDMILEYAKFADAALHGLGYCCSAFALWSAGRAFLRHGITPAPLAKIFGPLGMVAAAVFLLLAINHGMAAAIRRQHARLAIARDDVVSAPKTL